MAARAERLLNLLPEVFATREPGSLLNGFVLALGRELAVANGDVMRLLTSHWVDFAQAEALDRLAAAVGMTRQRVSDTRRKAPESGDGKEGRLKAGEKEKVEADEMFRLRIKEAVPYFTGGGTRQAITGALRWALGLPMNLARFREEIEKTKACPDPRQAAALIEELENLVRIEEFPSTLNTAEAQSETQPGADGNQSRAAVEFGGFSARATFPVIEWTVHQGEIRNLEIRFGDDGAGLRLGPDVVVHAGETLILRNGDGGSLAVLRHAGLAPHWEGGCGPGLPAVPAATCRWTFSATRTAFDVSRFDSAGFELSRYDSAGFDASRFDSACFEPSRFDSAGFDTLRFEGPGESGLPRFSIRISWRHFLPLTFNVLIPYHVDKTLERIQETWAPAFKGELRPWPSLPFDDFQQVVDKVRAAGVRGSVHFYLAESEDHSVRGPDRPFGALEHYTKETSAMEDGTRDMGLETEPAWTETQEARDAIALGAVFDVAVLDGPFILQ